MRRALAIALLLTGCWVTGDEVAARIDALDVDTDTDTDSDTEDLGELVLGEVTPDVGNNRGGTLVTIRVGPLDPERVPEVSFGGSLAELVSHDAESVTVRAPAVGIAGRADVVVRDGERSARATGGFFYWVDGSGRSGMLGTVSNHDLDRGYDLSDYFGFIPERHPSEMHSASLLYTEPWDAEYWQLYSDALDTCTRSYRYDGPSVSILQPDVDQVILDPQDSALVLRPDANGEVYGTPLGPGWLPASRGLAIQQDAGADGWFGFEIDDAVRLPSPGFRVTSPAADSSEGTIDPSFDLRWEGGVPGEVILVEMRRYDFLGDFQDEVTCALVDDGFHRINSSVWSNPSPFGGLVTLEVGRARTEDAILPTNASQVAVYGMHWWYGAAFFRL